MLVRRLLPPLAELPDEFVPTPSPLENRLPKFVLGSGITALRQRPYFPQYALGWLWSAPPAPKQFIPNAIQT